MAPSRDTQRLRRRRSAGIGAAAGEAIILDVRPVPEYVAGHVPGAISIPIEELTERLADLPTDIEIVAYCRGPYCVFAHEAVRLLTAHGRRAVRLADGLLDWRLAEHPIEIGAA